MISCPDSHDTRRKPTWTEKSHADAIYGPEPKWAVFEALSGTSKVQSINGAEENRR